MEVELLLNLNTQKIVTILINSSLQCRILRQNHNNVADSITISKAGEQKN